MNVSPAVTAAVVGFVFLIGGLAVGDTLLAVAAGVLGLVVGFLLHRSGMRPLVAVAMAAAAVVGAVIGKTIVDALCLPGTCAPLSWVAAVVTAFGALVGVGLVVALATRSFEEHHAAIEQQQRRGDIPPADDRQS